MALVLTRKPESAAEEKLAAGAAAGAALVAQIEKAEAEGFDFETSRDAASGQRFLTSRDLAELVAFDKKVREETGTGFFDFATLRDHAFTEYYKALDAKKAAAVSK